MIPYSWELLGQTNLEPVIAGCDELDQFGGDICRKFQSHRPSIFEVERGIVSSKSLAYIKVD